MRISKYDISSFSGLLILPCTVKPV